MSGFRCSSRVACVVGKRRNGCEFPSYMTPSCDGLIVSCHHRFQVVTCSTHDPISHRRWQDISYASLDGLSQESPHVGWPECGMPSRVS